MSGSRQRRAACKQEVELCRKDPENAARNILRLQAENLSLREEAMLCSAENTRIKTLARAVVDSVNLWGTTGEMYIVDAAEFDALAAALEVEK